LWLNHVPLTALQARWVRLATAQFPNTSQLIQQGIEQYKATGDVPGAIASWQTALTAYQSTKDCANEAIIREKLTIAYNKLVNSSKRSTI
jgi:hypothetical protein